MSSRDKRLCLSTFFILFLAISSSSTPREIQHSENLLKELLKINNDRARGAILEKHGDKLNKDLLSALIAESERLRLSFDYSNSMSGFKSAKLLSEKINDPAGTSEALRGIGRIHSFRSEFDQAMNYYQKALDVSEKVQDLAGKADALRLIAGIHAVHGKTDEQLKCYQESLKIEESIQNKAGIAKSIYSLGSTYLVKGDQELGFEYLQKSLKLAEEVDDKIEVAACVNSLGIYYDYRGNNDLALEYYKHAEELNRTSGDLFSLANNLHNIATVYYRQGNFMGALQYHLESLKIREKAENKRFVAFSLREIGTLYADQGELELALEYLSRSYNSLIAVNDRWTASAVLSDIGMVYNFMGEADKAIYYFNKALPENRKFYDFDTAITLRYLGETYVSKKQFDKARECFREALIAIEKTSRIDNKTGILERTAWAENEAGNHSEALRLADETTNISRKYGLPELLWSALLVQAKSSMALQQREKARIALEESIRILEGLRQEVAGGEEERGRYLERRTEPYAAMIELLIGDKKNEEALLYAERSKAKVLLDVMQKGRANVFGAMTEQEKLQESKLKEKLYLLNVQFREAILSDKPDNIAISSLKTKLNKARLEYEAFQTKLYAAHPELKVQRGESEVVGLEQSHALLPDDKTAFLEYVVTKNKTYLFFNTKSIFDVYQLKIDEDQLTTKVSSFRNQISKRDPGFYKNAKELYSSLLAPVASELKQLDRAIIIPDGILWELPFQALLADDGQYLLEKIAVSYAPSITALNEMHKNSHKNTAESTILAFANPLLGKETAEKVEMVFRGAQLHPLPEAEVEVKKLAKLYGSNHASIYVGPNAKESVLKQQIGKYDIIHLATHGILNETNPMYSHLLFSRSENNDPEDGLLEAWEIMNMDLHAGLVILSACETARGRIGAGEGMIGLNWAFFVAGCPRTVVSQWKVESSSTAEFMFRFHENLQQRGISEPEALQKAALSILKNPDYRHPFYWASFIIMGDPF